MSDFRKTASGNARQEPCGSGGLIAFSPASTWPGRLKPRSKKRPASPGEAKRADYPEPGLETRRLGEVIASVYSAASVSRGRSEEHTSELQSLMRISYAVLCLKKTKI